MPVRPRHCNGDQRRLETPLTAGAVGKVSPAARSQETTFVRATFTEPRGRSWWRSGVVLARARCGHSSERIVRFLFFRTRSFLPFILFALALACDKTSREAAAVRDD